MSDKDCSVELTPYTVHRGKELVAKGEDGNLYSGEWVRNLFSNSVDDSIALGHYENPVDGSAVSAEFEQECLLNGSAYIGEKGYGKTSLMLSHALQCAKSGDGLVYVDLKGEGDYQHLLSTLPDNRMSDVRVLRPGLNQNSDFALNFLKPSSDVDDSVRESEVKQIVNELSNIIKDGKNGWGATMDAVLEAVARQLVQSEEPYTVLDLYAVLAREDDREKFAEMFGDEVESIYLDRLKEMDTEELDPLLRRIQKWIDVNAVRNHFSHPEGASFGDIVDDDLIMILDLSRIPEILQKIVVTTVVRGIYAAKRARSLAEGHEQTPYHLFLDDYNMIGQNLPTQKLFSMGRGVGLGTHVAVQSISRLDEDDQKNVLASCDNIFMFNPGPGNTQDAGRLAQVFNMGGNQLTELSQYRFYTRFNMEDGNLSQPVQVNSFAPIPPLRDSDEVEERISNLAQEHGHEVIESSIGDFSEFGL